MSCSSALMSLDSVPSRISSSTIALYMSCSGSDRLECGPGQAAAANSRHSHDRPAHVL